MSKFPKNEFDAVIEKSAVLLLWNSFSWYFRKGHEQNFLM